MLISRSHAITASLATLPEINVIAGGLDFALRLAPKRAKPPMLT